MAPSADTPGLDGQAAASPRLDRTPLGHQIAEEIRNDILFGRLTAGTRVSQQELTERYGTSRMPVRDALRQLSYEGFVHDDGKGHSVVARFSQQELRDIYLIEGMLHGLAARRVTEEGDREHLDELAGYHEAMMAVEEQGGDAAEMARINWQFHRRINYLADSPKLLAVLRTHTLSIPRAYIRELPHWMHRANTQHKDIVEAMLRGRAATAEKRMIGHVVDAGEDLITYLESCGVDLG